MAQGTERVCPIWRHMTDFYERRWQVLVVVSSRKSCLSSCTCDPIRALEQLVLFKVHPLTFYKLCTFWCPTCLIRHLWNKAPLTGNNQMDECVYLGGRSGACVANKSVSRPLAHTTRTSVVRSARVAECKNSAASFIPVETAAPSLSQVAPASGSALRPVAVQLTAAVTDSSAQRDSVITTGGAIGAVDGGWFQVKSTGSDFFHFF